MVGPRASWAQEHELLATIVDGVKGLLWQNAPKGARPKPFPRPGRGSGGGERLDLTPTEMRARLLAQRARTGR